MVNFITVWVLTVTYLNSGASYEMNSHTYQLQYATQAICERQIKNHIGRYKEARCDFQQVPVYIGEK